MASTVTLVGAKSLGAPVVPLLYTSGCNTFKERLVNGTATEGTSENSASSLKRTLWTTYVISSGRRELKSSNDTFPVTPVK
jgi:hypothetical protein